ncbi:MAG: D-alanine--D-alanine ligase [Bacteroidetes bacterium]|nr:D-alanine--D-alanine ligase [Bacteroidota bacterium]
MYNIAIVAGGNSGEYEISMKSGKQVELNMDMARFRPFLIEIRGKKWNYKLETKTFPVDKNDFSLTIGKRKIRFDAVFNAIHGTPGEDGKLQGYFDMLDIPYTSCGVTTSALSFNKTFCKDVVSCYGADIAGHVHLNRDDKRAVSLIKKNLKMPVFVKPNNGGSSVGMSKVKHKKDLKAALDKAFHEDDEILVEEFIKGRELTCGVIRSKGKIIAFPVTEIISKKEFFDYEAKYQPGLSEEVVPAKVPGKVAETCRKISMNLFRNLNCKGIVRFDFIFSGKKFFFLEVNTVPGITSASIVPKMAKAYGWSYTDLITNLLDEII